MAGLNTPMCVIQQRWISESQARHALYNSCWVGFESVTSLPYSNCDIQNLNVLTFIRNRLINLDLGGKQTKWNVLAFWVLDLRVSKKKKKTKKKPGCGLPHIVRSLDFIHERLHNVRFGSRLPMVSSTHAHWRNGERQYTMFISKVAMCWEISPLFQFLC